MSSPAASLDLSGMKCPLVVLRIRRAMAGVAPGQTLQVVADDPMAAVDVPVMCHHLRFALAQAQDEHGRFLFAVTKPAGWMPPDKPVPIK
ncbi:MAG: sulfurtransferase TusA family protein [Rhodospirillaceae bacterium]|nr:sulfurtransferase TusA family protein [Rhodospirillaceae bacterium]